MNKKIIVFGIVILCLTSLVAAWSWIKVGNTIVVTLDSGNKVNVTDIVYVPSTKFLSAALIPERKLTIQDVVQIANITQSIQDQKYKKKNLYIQTRIIQ